jgi:hypothetical protein
MISERTVNPRPFIVRFLLIAIVGFVMCALPSPGSAAKPPANNNGQLSIAANPKQITFTHAVTISGKLKGTPNAGQGLMLQSNPYPYAGYAEVGTANTDVNGNYTFSVMPALNTRYRVTTTTVTPAETSGEITVLVAPRVSLSLSDRTPRSGQLVRFYGFVSPAHDGRTAQIQRLTTTGSWQTVARVTLNDDGDLRSKYSRRVRIRKNGTFRTQLLADADHATGLSTSRFVRVH